MLFWTQTPLSGHKNTNAPPRTATASRLSITIVIPEIYDSPSAEARIGRPGTALSVAGVHRRAYRRAVRRTVYGTGAAAVVGYGLAGTTAAMAIRPIPIPHRTPPTTEQATVMGRTTAVTAIRATPPHLTIPALLSASGGVTRVVQLSGSDRASRLLKKFPDKLLRI